MSIIAIEIANSKVILMNDLTNIICINQSIDALIVHPNYCNAYFQCNDNGQGIIQYCTNTTWFNDKTQLCDKSFNACILSDDNEINVVTTPSNSNTDDIISTTTIMVAEPSTTTKPNNTSTVSSSTTMVTTLRPSTSTLEASTTTTSITINLSTSIRPTDAITVSTSLNPTTIETTNIPSTATSSRPPVIDTIYNNCPIFDTPYLTYLPNHIDCSSYYLCYHGQSIKLFCPTRYHWHNEFKKCVPASQSNCYVWL